MVAQRTISSPVVSRKYSPTTKQKRVQTVLPTGTVQLSIFEILASEIASQTKNEPNEPVVKRIPLQQSSTPLRMITPPVPVIEDEITSVGETLPAVTIHEVPTDVRPSVQMFLNESGRYRPLSPEQIRALGRKAAAGDTKAREMLINHHLLLVVNIASSYARRYNAWHDFEELVSVGNLGMMQGVNGYDPEQGLFTTYISPWIHRNVHNYFHPRRQVTKLDTITIDDAVALPSTDSWNTIDTSLDVACLLEAANLKPYELEVIRSHYGIDCDTTKNFEQIGKTGSKKCTREYVRATHVRAMNKLKIASEQFLHHHA